MAEIDLKRLKTERIRRKIKIKDMAKMTGMSRNLVSGMEKGNDLTSIANFNAYVTALGDIDLMYVLK